MTKPGVGKRIGVTRDRVVDAAIGLVEREGADALSMRRLASELGLKPMSLYSHMDDKDDLLDAIAARVLREVAIPKLEGRPARETLAEAYTNFFAAMKRRPGVASILLRRPVRGDVGIWLELVDLRQRLLTEMGLTKQQAVDAGRSLAGLASGALLNDVQAARQPDDHSATQPTPLFDARRYPHLAEVVDEYVYPDFERSFRVGLNALLDGFEALAASNERVRDANN